MTRILITFCIVSCLRGQVPTNIISIPEGANIKINGREVGITPLQSFKIGLGKQEIEVYLEGFVKAEKTFDIQEAKSLNIEFRLKKLYNIKLKTKEIDIVFVFNKTDTIKQKKTKLLFEEGPHFLQVYRDGKILEEKVILIDAHKTIEYTLIARKGNQ